jgi:sugar lactone lactonase YvrE
MDLKSIRAFRLRDYRLEGWKERIEGCWSYRQLIADSGWRDGWISFDAVTYSDAEHLVYCGLNSIDGDLLYVFDPAAERFISLNARAWTDAYDVKIHRTLLRSPLDGCYYFGTSALHDVEDQRKAPGGKLVRYDPCTGKATILGIPAPRLYIQSIAADWERGLIYGFTYPAESVFRFDLATRETETLAWIGNAILFAQPHNAVVDRDGWLWGTYAETRAWDEILTERPIRLFKYHPEGDRFVCFEHGLSRMQDKEQLLDDPPKPRDVVSALAQTRHQKDYGFCDSMAYDGGSYIYAGTVAGVLCRIHTATGAVEKVAHVMAGGRFPSLAIRDGILYGGGGMNGHTQLMRWDIRTGSIETFNDLLEPERGERPARIHEIAVAPDHTLYLGENDNHSRSSYLWRVRLT